MAKLLFVCAGNSCRSPMAMIIAQKYFKGRHKCDSASGGEKVGGSVASKAVKAIHLLIQEDLSKYQPKALTEELIDGADNVFFLGENLLSRAQANFFEAKRINKMKLYDPLNKNVPDPFDGEFFPSAWAGKVQKATPTAYEAVADLMIKELTPRLEKEYGL